MITHFLLSIEPIANTIEKRGPEILFGGDFIKVVRPLIANILAHTQMTEAEIDWIEVVGNWGLPWPKGKSPSFGSY